uniref:F-box domain-containing protein n=1 Tax=Branchiostoma floridae TaxID=7739 RepID=C3XZ71_BRAFL|eukprot:XP_002610625.1 hypothetical protein BRAFLDRAFT_65815 [Branchiostoma floridae]
MVKISDSDDQPESSSSFSTISSPVDLPTHGTLLLHTPKTLQATQAAQNQPLKQYFQSELYCQFSCNAREVKERVEAEWRRRRDKELLEPLFRPTKYVKPPVWPPESPVSSRTRKPLISPHSSPPLVRRPLEQATMPANLNTEAVQVLVAKPFNTICKGIHGYDDKFPILMVKPPKDNDSQSSDVQKLAAKPKRYEKKSKGHLNSGPKASEGKKCEEIQEVLNKTDCTDTLDFGFAGKMSLTDQALECFQLLPDRVLTEIFLHLDSRSLAAFKCSCQDFKWLVEMYEVSRSDAELVSDPVGKVHSTHTRNTTEYKHVEHVLRPQT